MSSTPYTVIGINFGGSASSVAVISKDGLADCIANDDGERQISNALSFSGEEEYVGIPAKSQLVRNNVNTILNFRNLLGKNYESVSSVKPQFSSAPIVSGPDGAPAYKVSVKDAETTLTAQDAATKYLTTLIGFASDFLGRKINGAVVGVPSEFEEAQLQALEKAIKDAAGVEVLQFLHEPAAACVAYGLTNPSAINDPSSPSASTSSATSQDRNVVVLDVGATSTTATVLSARSGLYVPLASVRDPKLGGESFDEQLLAFFSKEFTKKTKVTISPSDHRANMKLRLACEIAKRTLSASNSATCSVESLAEGMDFSGSINRSRFDLLSAKVYTAIQDRVKEAVEKAGLDLLQISEVIMIGGTSKNPTLCDRMGLLFPESTLVSTQIEPDEVISRGCVLQAQALRSVPSGSEEAKYFTQSSLAAEKAKILSKPIGLLVPAPVQNGDAQSTPGLTKDGKTFVTILEANTPLPARRIVALPFSKDAKSVSVSVYEGQESVHVQAPAAKPERKTNGAEDDEDDYSDDEEEETRTKIIEPKSQLAELVVAVKSGSKQDLVKVTVIVDKDEEVHIEAVQEGSESSKQSVEL